MTELYNAFDKGSHLKPDFSKTEFDELHAWDLGWALLEPINIAEDKESEKALSKRLSPGQKALYFFWYLDSEVSNGGFIQFYWNENRKYLSAILEGLKLVDDKAMIKLVEAADRIYTKNTSRFQVGDSQENFEKLYNELADFEELDLQYFESNDTTMELIEAYIRENPDAFVNLV